MLDWFDLVQGYCLEEQRPRFLSRSLATMMRSAVTQQNLIQVLSDEVAYWRSGFIQHQTRAELEGPHEVHNVRSESCPNPAYLEMTRRGFRSRTRSRDSKRNCTRAVALLSRYR